MPQAPTITASTTDYLLNLQPPTGLGSDNFILQIDSFSNGSGPVSLPGLGTTYGLDLEGTVTVQGNPSVYGPGTVKLMLDPTDNDGTPAATWDDATQSGSVGFSNLVNTTDDITLATSSVISGEFGTQSNGQPGLDLLSTFKLNPLAFGPKLSFLSSMFDLDAQLFNTSTSRIQGSMTDGGTYVTVNDGYGVLSLRQPSPPDLHALGNQSLGADMLARLGIPLPRSGAATGWAGSDEPTPGAAASALYNPDGSAGQALMKFDHG